MKAGAYSRRGERSGFGDFRCGHCHQYVSANPLLSGVQNRNHCPYCLWSRHVDLFKAGDRLCACKALMQPVGVTLKRRHKRYMRPGQGELMIVHLCVECGGLSINRVAADDDADALLAAFEAAQHHAALLHRQMQASGIQPLSAAERPLVQMQFLI
ncbi:MAG TPA: RNHCP domain-containing protein [Anaerolineaceae bacterium]|nr:RNHCP domain-containing protein [Anaerolineaceae bacterium]